MSVDKTTIEHIAHLARLEFKEEAMDTMINDMNRMLAFVDKLNELPTDGIEPLIYMVDEVNVMREDVVKQEITREEGLMNAPKHDSDFFRVPKVIEQK